MEKIDFLKNKEELKILARKSVLFKTLPDNLEKFEKEIDELEESTGGGKILLYFIDFFKEINQQTTSVISTLRSALSA